LARKKKWPGTADERRNKVFKKFLLIALMVCAMAVVAYAADDDASPTDDDATPADDDASPPADDDSTDIFGLTGTAGGAYPVMLKANTQYDFAFDVFNKNGGTIAIKKVDISLPSKTYKVDGTVAAPKALHPTLGTWKADYAEATATITWEFQGMVSSAEVGDIKEGETLTFSFVATTDAAGTDGFAWTLTGDDAAATFVSGVWDFSGGEISPTDDDESPVPHPGSNNNSGCGC